MIFNNIMIKDLKQQTVVEENPDHDIITKIKKDQRHNDKTHQHQKQSEVLAAMLICHTVLKYQNERGVQNYYKHGRAEVRSHQ